MLYFILPTDYKALLDVYLLLWIYSKLRDCRILVFKLLSNTVVGTSSRLCTMAIL